MIKSKTQNIWKVLVTSLVLVAALACLDVPSAWARTTIKKVQSGTTSFTTVSTDVTITSVDLTKSFLVFSYRVDNNTPSQIMVRGQISSATNVHFERIAGTATVNVAWYVAEFTNGVTVQRNENGHTSATTDVTITGVTTAQSFPLVSYFNDGSTYGTDDNLSAELTSSTNLRLAATAAINNANAVSWQVVDYTGASVQTGTTTLGAGTGTTTAAISSVDLNKSVIFASETVSGNMNADDASVDVKFNSATQLGFQRDGTTNSVTVKWSAVTFSGGEVVLSGTQAFTNAETQVDVTLSRSVSTTRSIAFCSMYGKHGRSADAADDNPRAHWFTAELTSGTNLRLTRAATGSATANISWFVVEFPRRRVTITDH